MGNRYKTWKDYLDQPLDVEKQKEIIKNVKFIRNEKMGKSQDKILEYRCPVCFKVFYVSHTLKQYTFKRTLSHNRKLYSMIMCGYNCTRDLEKAFGKDVKNYRTKGVDEND